MILSHPLLLEYLVQKALPKQKVNIMLNHRYEIPMLQVFIRNLEQETYSVYTINIEVLTEKGAEKIADTILFKEATMC